MIGSKVFQKIVTKLTDKLAINGLLAAGGTAIAPAIGTAIGVGAGFLSDFLFLKADEMMNREGYKQELADAIEESRNEMLALVKAS